MDELDEMLENILNQNYLKIIFYEEKILRKLGDITLKELRTLEIIAKGEKTKSNNSTAIAKALGITLGTLTANIDRLIKKGLVDKDKLLEDKRTTVLSVTQLGKKILKEYSNEHLKIIRSSTKNLTQKEKAIVVSLVNKFDI